MSCYELPLYFSRPLSIVRALLPARHWNRVPLPIWSAFLRETGHGCKRNVLTSQLSRSAASTTGRLRNVLISYLDFKDEWQKELPVSHLLWKPEYPAAQALVNIGVPATGNLIRAIGETLWGILSFTGAPPPISTSHSPSSLPVK